MTVLTDLQGVVKGEVTGASQLKISLRLKGIPSVSLEVPLWHSRAADMLAGDCLLKVYRRDASTNRLIFNGPILSAEENGDPLKQSVAVTAVGPFWRLTKRIIGTTKAGIQFGTEAVPRDLARIARDVIVAVNGAGYTGIQPNADVDDAGIANGSTGQLWLKNAAELIGELAAALNSFDWRVDPTEPTSVGQAWPQIGTFFTAPLIGAQKPNVIFEYGTPRANVGSYNRAVSRDEILNQALVSVQGWPDATARDIVTRNDSTSQTARGLFQEVVPDAGIFDDTMRQKIGDEHLLYRAKPKTIIKFTPSVNALPQPFVHYDVGDWVRARADVRGSTRFDAFFRVWGLTLSVDDGGNESVDLNLVDE